MYNPGTACQRGSTEVNTEICKPTFPADRQRVSAEETWGRTQLLYKSTYSSSVLFCYLDRYITAVHFPDHTSHVVSYYAFAYFPHVL